MAAWQRIFAAGALAATVAVCGRSVHAERDVSRATHVRSTDPRVLNALRYGLTRSASFGDVIATLDSSDQTVYIESGPCQPRELRSCLHTVLNREARIVVVRIDAGQPLKSLVAQLAHELFHAVEIAQEPSVIDAGSMRLLYERIGYPSCFDGGKPACWETRAACTFENLVKSQLASRHSNREETGRP